MSKVLFLTIVGGLPVTPVEVSCPYNDPGCDGDESTCHDACEPPVSRSYVDILEDKRWAFMNSYGQGAFIDGGINEEIAKIDRELAQIRAEGRS